LLDIVDSRVDKVGDIGVMSKAGVTEEDEEEAEEEVDDEATAIAVVFTVVLKLG
jgi:hypothetical protein